MVREVLGSVSYAVTDPGVLRRRNAVKMVHALVEIESGVRSLTFCGMHRSTPPTESIILTRPAKSTTMKFCNIQPGETVHGVQRAAGCRGEEISAGFVIGTCEDGIEHDVILCGNRALRRFALRHVHQGISWNGDQVDFLAVGGDLHTIMAVSA